MQHTYLVTMLHNYNSIQTAESQEEAAAAARKLAAKSTKDAAMSARDRRLACSVQHIEQLT